MGVAGKKLQAVYSRVNGHKLTDEERDLLDANREALIARLKGIREIENYPPGTGGEITVTKTGRSIYQRRKI